MQPVGDFAAGAFLVYSPRDGDEERHADGLPNMAGNWPGLVPCLHRPRQTRADPEAHEAGKSIAWSSWPCVACTSGNVAP
jgi:hypothetical protein